jgi:hypothetical protein
VIIPDWYQTITEVAIGLAGFSGLVVALRRGTGPLSEIQKFRMSVLFGMTFGALFLSMTPGVLTTFGVIEKTTWALSATAMIVWSSLFVYYWISRSRQVAGTVPEIFHWRVFTVMTIGHIGNLLLQLGLLFSLTDLAAPGIFGAGLLWYLVHGSQQFVRMLFIQPRVEHES